MENADASRLIRYKEALIQDFLAGKETRFLEKLTAALDEYLFSVFEKSIAARKMVVAGNPFALIALLLVGGLAFADPDDEQPKPKGPTYKNKQIGLSAEAASGWTRSSGRSSPLT